MPGPLNVIVDKLSRHTQIIQPGDIQPDLALVAHTPNRLVFHQVQQKTSPVPDKEAWAVYALHISWKDMNGYAFPPTPLIANAINKILSHDCFRIIVWAGPTCHDFGNRIRWILKCHL